MLCALWPQCVAAPRGTVCLHAQALGLASSTAGARPHIQLLVQSLIAGADNTLTARYAIACLLGLPIGLERARVQPGVTLAQSGKPRGAPLPCPFPAPTALGPRRLASADETPPAAALGMAAALPSQAPPGSVAAAAAGLAAARTALVAPPLRGADCSNLALASLLYRTEAFPGVLKMCFAPLGGSLSSIARRINPWAGEAPTHLSPGHPRPARRGHRLRRRAVRQCPN